MTEKKPNIEGIGSDAEHERANATVKCVNSLVEIGVASMPHESAKVALAAGCAIPPLAVIALALGKDRPETKSMPTVDEVTFGALYFICGIERYGGGIIAGFTTEIVDKAMIMFKELTGRDYTDIHPVLLSEIARKKAGATERDVPLGVKKFMPH